MGGNNDMYFGGGSFDSSSASHQQPQQEQNWNGPQFGGSDQMVCFDHVLGMIPVGWDSSVPTFYVIASHRNTLPRHSGVQILFGPGYGFSGGD